MNSPLIEMSNRYALSRIFGRDLMSPAALRQRARNVTDMILNAVRCRADAY